MDPSVQIACIPIVSASAVIISNAMLAMMVRITSVIFLIAFIVYKDLLFQFCPCCILCLEFNAGLYQY